MGRKQIKDTLSKELIVEEADRQFLELDFNKVSMRSIASALGCTHGSIYYHFQNKEELFNAVIEKYFTMLNQMLENSLNLDAIEGTKQIFINYMQFGLNNQSQYDFMFVQHHGLEDPLQQPAPRKSLKKFIDTIQELHQNRLKEDNIHSTFISLHGFVLYYKGRIERYDDAKIAANAHADFLLKALVI
ncbi:MULTISPECIES: TetR/AcrR family transcriptional regulator [Solibacillus]|uniref:TetR/AcrR family transcriptional regulator n=1 Tax=Solibacillus merdavium TaxID=2762218 RepID=A0ABR8XME6_9BACL|nr:TetR/AcrR family transcriptional regulator [Solibacillus merdavium]MBD8033105.1 TetR/AcrR family transcriptional regulator [Solibacillus merdavium]